MRTFRWFKIVICIGFLASICIVNSVFAAEWVQAVTKKSGAAMFREPSLLSLVLGRYPAGTHLKVYSQDQGGFYAIYFASAWQGVHYAWVSKDELDLSAASSPALIVEKNKLSKIRLGVTYSLFNPNSIQTALGDSSYSVPSLGVNGEFQFHLSRWLIGLINVGQFSFSQLTQSGVNAGNPYFAHGYTLSLGVGLSLLEKSRVSMSLGVLGGVSFDTAGNTNGSGNTISTTSIVEFPMVMHWVGDCKIYKDLGLYLKLGYQVHSLSAVPVLASGTTVQTDANLPLTGLFGGLGLNYSF